MAVVKAYNLAKMTTATTGTGTITLGSAVSGFLTFANAGVQDGETVSYGIRDGANSEVGRGVYTTSGTTLTRSVLTSTNGNSAINLSGSATVFITPLAQDVITPSATIVQTKQQYNSGGTLAFTATSAPTDGNLLVAFCTASGGNPAAATGWTKIIQNTSGLDWSAIFVRCASSDTTSINPSSSTGIGSCALAFWEISGANMAMVNAASVFSAITNDQATTTPATTSLIGDRNGLLLFGFLGTATGTPSLSTGTSDGNVTASTRNVASGHVATSAGNYTITATYSGSGTTKAFTLLLLPSYG